MWYYLEKEENDVKLAYRNFVPRQKEAAAKTTDHPLLEDLPTTVNRMNEELKDNPLNGNSVDSISEIGFFKRANGKLHNSYGSLISLRSSSEEKKRIRPDAVFLCMQR